MRCLSVIVVAFAVVACHDVPQAPTLPTPPASGPFAVLHVDHVIPLSDCCGLIAGTTLFSDDARSLHLLYGAWDVGAVRYAGCATNCDVLRSWRIGEVDSSFYGIGDGGQVAAGLTPTGIHLLYQSNVGGNGQTASLSYGWCPGACYLKSSWSRAVVDTMVNVAPFGGGVSAVVDPVGGIHALYLAPTGVRYAECPASCTTVSNWQGATLDSAALPATALALGADGRLHALYFHYPSLWYATCAAACGSSASWQRGAIATRQACCHLNGWATIAIGSDNRVHAFFSTTSDTSWRVGALTYITCTASCTSAVSWQSAILDSSASLAAIALDPAGTIHAAWGGNPNGGVEYARCESACLSPASWSRTPVDSTTRAESLTLALSGTSKPVIAYASFYNVYVALMR
jgi:hypothetical protein